MTNTPTLFRKEDEVLKRAADFLKQFPNEETPFKKEYERLLKDYKKLFKQTKILVKMSDKQQNQLTTRTEGLQSSNIELQHKAKEAEEAVRATEKKLAQFLEAVSIGVFVMDAEGRPYYANQKAKEILGKNIIPSSNTEELSEVYQIYLAGSTQLYSVENMPIIHALKGQVYSVDDMEIRQRDKIIPIEVWGTPIFDEQGKVVYAIAAFQDITKRRSAEEKLLLTQFSVEHAADAIFWIGSDARLLYVNEAAVRLLGYSRQELYAMTVHDIEPNLPVEAWTERWEKVKSRGCLIFESYHQAKDGIIFPVEITFNYTIFNGVEYNFSFVRDITERKQAEAERLRFTETLAQLNKAYERFVPHQFLSLLDKKSVIDIHLGDQVEKEMTILFSDIRGFTSLSEKMLPQENFNFINAYLSRMEPIIHEHHGVIDKYIGDAIMALFPNNADDAVRAALSMLTNLANDSLAPNSKLPPLNIGIGIHTGHLMLGTIGGQNRMDGTVISDAVNLASRIEDLTKIYGTSLLISEETYTKLEDPYQYNIRVIDATKVKGKSKTITIYEVFDADTPECIALKNDTIPYFEPGFVLYHSGDSAEAKPLFETVLQVNPDDTAAQVYLERCQKILSLTMPNKPIILIVDDAPFNIKILANLLGNHFEVLAAENGKSALELIKLTPPQLILLDVMMPELDGYEVCKQLKANPKTEDISIIFITALSEAADKVKGFQLGAVDYITKPFQREEVLARVKIHLHLSHLQRQAQWCIKKIKNKGTTFFDQT